MHSLMLSDKQASIIFMASEKVSYILCNEIENSGKKERKEGDVLEDPRQEKAEAQTTESS